MAKGKGVWVWWQQAKGWGRGMRTSVIVSTIKILKMFTEGRERI